MSASLSVVTCAWNTNLEKKKKSTQVQQREAHWMEYSVTSSKGHAFLCTYTVTKGSDLHINLVIG